MAFNGTEGGPIKLSDGSRMTSDYRANNPGARKGNFYGKEILMELLSQSGAVGIRMYYAEDANGEKELVLVAADADENDILDLVADLSSPCPGRCGIANSLNS